jgi:hypothetical protein
MKKLFVFVFLVSVVLMASRSPYAEKLIGVWKIQSMDIKGTKMLHQELGLPYIEFNEEGGFMVKVSSSLEKGKYALKGNIVTLKFLYPKKPIQKIVITKLDDKELDYSTSDSTGEVKVTCFRITTGLGSGKD